MPVGTHSDTGPTGAIYLGAAGYRARMRSALAIEDVLVKPPKPRVYIMHAGYPMIDDLLTVLYAHPKVYVDVGIIVHNQPRPASIGTCRRSPTRIHQPCHVWVRSDGLGGNDRSRDCRHRKAFLSKQQKRDIFYNNAAHFPHLSKEVIARHPLF